MIALALAVSIAALIGVAFAADRLLSLSGSRDAHEALVIFLCRRYSRWLHRLRVSGTEHIPRRRDAGAPPLIIVANHTAGVDPVLVQAACPFLVSWVMAEDMALPELRTMWDIGDVITVNRERADGLSAREVIRRLRAGRAIGVFPEGFIERPPRVILPFQPGVGLFAARTGAVILPIVIDGAPQVEPAWASLWRPSRSMLKILPPRRYAKGAPAREIADDLRRVFLEETGWRAAERPVPPPAPRTRGASA